MGANGTPVSWLNLKADFHTHSYRIGSHVKSSPEHLVLQAINAGLDLLSITDDRDYIFDKVREKPSKYLPGIKLLDDSSELLLLESGGQQIFLMRGMEYRISDGHFLIIGGEKENIHRQDLGEMLKASVENGAIVGPAHPLNNKFAGCSMETISQNLRYFSFIESFNALSTKKYNRESTKVAIELGLSQISTSDDHRGKPGSSYTTLSVETTGDLNLDSQEIKNAIVNNQIIKLHRRATGCLSKLNTFVIPRLKTAHSIEEVKRVYQTGYRYWKS